MRYCVLGMFVALWLPATINAQDKYPGFFDFTWDGKEGKIWLDVSDRWDEEFLYISGLSAGVGSNDIGLDRNQLGESRLVKFVKSGPKLLLVEQNTRYRAVSDNADERKAVEEAFAQSVLWGFKIEERNSRSVIDLTPFLLRDAHSVAKVLDKSHQGAFKVDEPRSAMNLSRTKNFPENSEFDAIVTLIGNGEGSSIKSVTPDADFVTVHVHHAFVKLPDDGYTPRIYDPRSGFIPLTFADYATPIDQPLERRFITRHRLEKKNPELPVSDPVEPIIYYIDRGCPEPIKSALMEGASWWNQAFEAAGYRNAFQVRELPEGADPMDVRYNMINWVHRSTRGWSYGGGVVDPRTGEIIKGHVLLGSLRVRQDYLIAQGLTGEFHEDNNNSDELKQMALARLRQLSAHEVGHTLGLMHNFAASYNDRASVMDYPHPYVVLGDNGKVLLDSAYAVGIGAWDKRMILYGYQDFPAGVDETIALDQVVNTSLQMGLKYITDEDSRPEGSANPYGHLWDNANDPVKELRRVIEIRRAAMRTFGEERIAPGTALAYLEEVLVPLYYFHRYQVEAAAKLIGGVEYAYNLRGDIQTSPRPVGSAAQSEAMDALMETLTPDFLKLQGSLLNLIPPRPAGYDRHRELFAAYTGLTLDPMAIAESSAEHTLGLMLNPERLARIQIQAVYDPSRQSLTSYLRTIDNFINKPSTSADTRAFQQIVQKQFVLQLLNLAADPSIQPQVSAAAMLVLNEVSTRARAQTETSHEDDVKAHALYVLRQIQNMQDDPEGFILPKPKAMPPGSPIGCGYTEE